MNKRDGAAEKARLRDGVFQPGKAEIAKEMERRLELKDDEEERPERATADRH